MSVKSLNCGAFGWVSDALGYRYSRTNLRTDLPCPKIPDVLLELADSAASKAGYNHFIPNSCLINHYECGAKMSLHQDKNESDFSAPIVSVSLGVPATFLWGRSQN